MQDPKELERASQRLRNHLIRTPVVSSDLLNQMLGHQIFFKLEALQHTGAFKVRGALNYLLSLPELPKFVVASTTGNNGVGVAFATKSLGIKARIYIPESSARVKVEKAAYYGAEIIRTKTNAEAALAAKSDGRQQIAHYFPSSESDFVIAGAGTMCYEALNQVPEIDCIFASCATGGMLSGCVLARNLASPQTKVFGVEPKDASDASTSIKTGKVVQFADNTNSIADGLKVPSVAERTLVYLQALNGFFLVEEQEIIYWTKVLMRFLQVQCEPACAINMAAVAKWLHKQTSPKRVMVLISGGNMDCKTLKFLHESEWLPCRPNERETESTTFLEFASETTPQGSLLQNQVSKV